MKPLEILEKYDINGLNKNCGTDKGSDHSYLEPYERILNPYIDKETTILEIGVKFGGSAILWHEYLPKSKLVLMDLHSLMHDKFYEILNKDRFVFFNRDAYTDDTIMFINDNYQEGFDIIIDDGTHLIEHQLFCVQRYLPFLKKDGIFVIEDINTDDHLQMLKDAVPEKLKNKIEIIDLRHIRNRHDDLMFIVRNCD